MDNIQEYLEIGTGVVTVASLVANQTKTDSDNKVISWISKIINLFAFNFTKATK